MTEHRSYTQAEVDELRKDWESAAFELKTKEVLQQINKRLDESNNYKATIGKDLRDIKVRIESIELVRALEAKKLAQELGQKKDAEANKRSWHQDWWVRIGIGSGVIYTIIYLLQSLAGIPIAGHHLFG
jgi:hypothetical protein